MAGRLARARGRFPGKLILWAGLTLLLAGGLLFSIADLAKVPIVETRRANMVQQRIIIDPMTGLVAGKPEQETPFDVAPEEAGETPPVSPPTEPAEITLPPANAPAAKPNPSPSTSSFEPLTREHAAAPAPTAPSAGQGLVRAPAREITETVDGVNVPKKSSEGLRPSTLYAHRFTRSEDQALVSIVITDVGFSEQTLPLLLALPSEISMAVSPYAPGGSATIAALRKSGHETWAMLPTIGSRYPQTDPGPLGIVSTLSATQALQRLHRVLSATLGSVGAVLAPDETLSANAVLWPAVLQELDRRGLYVLSTHPTRSIAQLSADPAIQEHVRRADLVADTTPGLAFINSKLAGVKQAAMAQKKLIVLLSARPQGLKALAAWLKENPLGEHATFAPLSAMYAKDEPPPAPPKEGGHGASESSHEADSEHGDDAPADAHGGH